MEENKKSTSITVSAKAVKLAENGVRLAGGLVSGLVAFGVTISVAMKVDQLVNGSDFSIANTQHFIDFTNNSPIGMLAGVLGLFASIPACALGCIGAEYLIILIKEKLGVITKEESEKMKDRFLLRLPKQKANDNVNNNDNEINL